MGQLRAIGEFLLRRKKWWLAPIGILFVLVIVLALLSGSGASPLNYSWF